MVETMGGIDSNKKGFIYKIFNTITKMLRFVFVEEGDHLELGKGDKMKGFIDNQELDSMGKRDKNKFFKDYDYVKKK